jgi:hypothetical protein
MCIAFIESLSIYRNYIVAAAFSFTQNRRYCMFSYIIIGMLGRKITDLYWYTITGDSFRNAIERQQDLDPEYFGETEDEDMLIDYTDMFLDSDNYTIFKINQTTNEIHVLSKGEEE